MQLFFEFDSAKYVWVLTPWTNFRNYENVTILLVYVCVSFMFNEKECQYSILEWLLMVEFHRHLYRKNASYGIAYTVEKGNETFI